VKWEEKKGASKVDGPFAIIASEGSNYQEMVTSISAAIPPNYHIDHFTHVVDHGHHYITVCVSKKEEVL
jgi:hypothetical protein